jgi:hypothetical protein
LEECAIRGKNKKARSVYLKGEIFQEKSRKKNGAIGITRPQQLDGSFPISWLSSFSANFFASVTQKKKDFGYF